MSGPKCGSKLADHQQEEKQPFDLQLQVAEHLANVAESPVSNYLE
jgi:hypothetical protein